MNSHAHPKSCLLVGYCGNGNIGSEVRMITIIDDLRIAYGDDVKLTVVSQNRKKTLQIISETETLRVVEIPFQFPLFFGWKVAGEIRRHDATLLIEGSTFKDNWSSWLLYAYLWTVLAARMFRKTCIAYAVDVGDMSRLNQWLTKSACSKIDLMITRTEIARQRLLKMGITSHVHAYTDTAFSYFPDESNAFAPTTIPLAADEKATIVKKKSETTRKKIGLAAVEFYHWPVKLKLFGPKKDCYRWPYFFTWTDERRAKSRQLVETYVRFVTDCVMQRKMDVTLIAMEELDRGICEQVLAGLPTEVREHVDTAFSGNVLPAQMVPLLRRLDYLVTSRYHACVLSMAGSVPQMAICHDERLESIYEELGIDEDYLIDYRDPHLESKLHETFARLVDNSDTMPRTLRKRHDEFFVPRCAANRTALVGLGHIETSHKAA
ncbi:MAG: polysaccharide pyruvyl transferase family protein [Planctomycetota bacterium]|nr:polysaccharide pyruvyl transferase family protein [Planctomycetota bacterium]